VGTLRAFVVALSVLALGACSPESSDSSSSAPSAEPTVEQIAVAPPQRPPHYEAQSVDQDPPANYSTPEDLDDGESIAETDGSEALEGDGSSDLGDRTTDVDLDAAENSELEADADLVSYNVRSHKYHEPSCRYYGCGNCEEMPRGEAVARDGIPCQVCR
jgi:hypothetical protein